MKNPSYSKACYSKECYLYFFFLSLFRQLIFLQATALIQDICRNLHTAAKSVQGADYTVVLRGDSTLRGHFPEARILIELYLIIYNFTL